MIYSIILLEVIKCGIQFLLEKNINSYVLLPKTSGFPFQQVLVSILLQILKLSIIGKDLICIISTVICSFINLGKTSTLLVRLFICLIIPNISFFLLYHNTVEYKETLLLINEITKGKIVGILTKLGLSNKIGV